MGVQEFTDELKDPKYIKFIALQHAVAIYQSDYRITEESKLDDMVVTAAKKFEEYLNGK